MKMHRLKFKYNLRIPKWFLQIVFICASIVLIFFVIIGGILFYNRAEIFSVLANNYIKNNPQLFINNSQNAPVIIPEITEDEEKIIPPDTIISAVEKANPAVVAITIYKEVPKYEITYKSGQQETSTDLFGNKLPSIIFNQPVYTQTGTEKKVVGGGSGFLVSQDGYIVTNKHVVSNTDYEYSITLNSGKKYTAKVLARDQVLDVAILKVDAKNLPFLELADSSTLQLGQSVIAIGNALAEFKNSISTGIISGLSRKVTAGDGKGMVESLDKVIQTDAAINPGNSGGPLLNLAGKVVGVNVAVAKGAENIGFALPINSVKGVIDQVRKTGKIVRPFVGVRYVLINDEVKQNYNLSVDYGVIVAKGKNPDELAVIPGSPADLAGIVENDIILEIDGKKINEDQNFANLIREKKVGNTIKLKILSKGVEKTVSLKLGKSPDNQ